MTVNRFEDKVVVITGAAKGIGRATAQLFAEEGARLVLGDLDSEALDDLCDALRSEGCEVVGVAGDVAEESCVAETFRRGLAEFGRIDVLVANAGVIVPGGILDLEVADWDRIMNIDARGMFLSCQYAVRAMSAGAGGSIVCLSSISGVAGQSRQAAYGPAKFVASGLTKHLAVEWANHGIRVNAVAPGTIATEAVLALPDNYVEPLRQAHPVQRLGEPREVAEAIAFLASDQASFITGVVLPVDGGYLAQ